MVEEDVLSRYHASVASYEIAKAARNAVKDSIYRQILETDRVAMTNEDELSAEIRRVHLNLLIFVRALLEELSRSAVVRSLTVKDKSALTPSDDAKRKAIKHVTTIKPEPTSKYTAFMEQAIEAVIQSIVDAAMKLASSTHPVQNLLLEPRQECIMGATVQVSAEQQNLSSHRSVMDVSEGYALMSSPQTQEQLISVAEDIPAAVELTLDAVVVAQCVIARDDSRFLP
ncbi:hypothetical protein FI667_g1279, partial [Globisporangium splendens]